MGTVNLEGFLDIAPEGSNVDVGDASKIHKNKRIITHRDFELKDWLASLSLSEYYHALFNEGFDKPLSLKLLTNEDLIEVGIKKKGHRLILLNAVKDHYFTSLPSNPGLYYNYGQKTSIPSSVSSTNSSSSSAAASSSSSQSTNKHSGQLVPMGYIHHDSPAYDSDMDDIHDLNNLSSSQYLDPSSASSSFSFSPHEQEYDDSNSPSFSSQTIFPSPSITKKSNSKSSISSSSSSSSVSLSQPSSTPDSQKATRKRARADKPEQQTTQDETPKPKPASVTFVPNQHYSRSDVHDNLGGQRFCAISTPSSYPIILIFAHYQASPGEDGTWEHCASGDVNKGVNRSVINSKDRKKQLLLFLSISGQQGAVLFVGEVKYVSCEQREEKNSKGVDKAHVIFKLQKINNESITITIIDYRTIDPLASLPKPVIRSLAENPNSYSTSSDTPLTPSSNINDNNNNNNNNNINVNNNNNSNNNNSLSSESVSPSLSMNIPTNPTSPALSLSSSLNSPSSPSPSFLLSIKQEDTQKDDTDKIFSNDKTYDNSSFQKILNTETNNETNENEESQGWTNSITNITNMNDNYSLSSFSSSPFSISNLTHNSNT